MKAGRKGNLKVATEVNDNWPIYIPDKTSQFIMSSCFTVSYYQTDISSSSFTSYGWGTKNQGGYFGVS